MVRGTSGPALTLVPFGHSLIHRKTLRVFHAVARGTRDDLAQLRVATRCSLVETQRAPPRVVRIDRCETRK
ncbi:hypothetical protein [Natronorubrum tibetense]|uniref:Uncharacterized protein n=1 Tax=Natronorubrum tibetense GA33 TaxID=1114856 RepID=L9W424_9EURY|nr:hypothetical protein [Natronorubrum tibetense]ELY44072.1 hypothetical protein C496_04650 [Natronorubrum tibetense GA33]